MAESSSYEYYYTYVDELNSDDSLAEPVRKRVRSHKRGKGAEAGGEAEQTLATKYKKARKAFAEGDVEATVAAHRARTQGHGEAHKEAGEYVKALVFGGLDGIVTTFAVVAGVAGANLSTGIVLVLGFANLIADGLSMGVGEFVSGRAEIDFLKAEQAREEWEVENAIEEEKQEMIDLYQEKGMTLEDAITVVDIISKDKKLFVDIMMVEELGLNPEDADGSPGKQGAVMFFSFLTFGAVPLVVYLISRLASGGGGGGVDVNFALSCVFTAITLFALGAVKAKLTSAGRLTQLIEGGMLMVLNGGISALAAFGVGYFLRFLIEDDSNEA